MRLNKRNSSRRGRKSAEYLMISDRSGFRYPASEIVREWTGALVAKGEEEPRHPQDFVRGVVDDYAVRNPRPRAPYEATLITESPAVGDVSERDGELVVDRAGAQVQTRSFDYDINTPLFTYNLGSLKDISRVIFTVTELTSGNDFLNIYTSEDGVTYDRMGQPFVDIIRDYTVGEPQTVSIGRRAQFIQMRLETINGPVSTNFAFSQFDVIGEV